MSKKKIAKPTDSWCSRRQFLSMSGLAAVYLAQTNPYNMFFRALSDSLINQANAAALGITSKNYLAVLFGGAPPRWTWDSFLCPSGNMANDFIKNGSVHNFLPDNTYSADNSKAEYRVEPVNGLYSNPAKVIYMSPLWNRTIPTSDGNAVAMRELLKNAVLIRGVNMGQDKGHTQGTSLLVHPEATAPSLSGIVGDHHPHSYIKATALGAYNAYSFLQPTYGGHLSANGTGIVMTRDNLNLTPTGNPFAGLLSPFKEAAATIPHSEKMGKMKPYMEDAMSELKRFSSLNYPGSDALYKAGSTIEELALKNLSSIGAEYPGTVARYRNLITRSAEPLANIIPGNDYGSYRGSTPGFSYHGLAAQFAMAELLFLHDLSFNVTISITQGQDIAVNSINNYRSKIDEHSGSDRQQSVINFSCLYRAMAACIYEFKTRIGNSKWENTVVQVGAEYDRAPDNTGAGTDHAANANMYTFFSGAIQEPILIGNILKNGSSREKYKGTWGASAPTLVRGVERVLSPQMGVSTAAMLLGIPSPIRAESLLNESGGRFVSAAEEPKNV